jgi:polyferredoxin
VLVFTVYVTTNSLRLLFLEIDPYYALFNFWSSEATIGGIIVLIIILMSSLFVERPWCKYACPFGALVGISNLFSIFKIKRNKTTCVGCKKCDAVCPMNIEVSTKEVIRDHQCIRCGKCTSEESCPIENTVELRVQSFKEANNETK